VDIDGEVLQIMDLDRWEDTINKALSGDLHQSLAASQRPAEASYDALAEVCDYVIYQAEILKAACGTRSAHDAAALMDGLEALSTFVDDDEPYEGHSADVAAYMTKAAGADGSADATIAELVKSAVAEVSAPLVQRIETLQEELAKVKATPVAGDGPFLVAPQNFPALNKGAQVDPYLIEAQRPNLDPSIARIMRGISEEGALTS
jgi:hypothetical protein